MRRANLLLAMVFTALLCLSGIGVTAAEPPELQKNQILVEASCKENGQKYTFVINGMSKTGDVKASTSNVVVKQYKVRFFDVNGTLDEPPGSGDDVLVGSDKFGNKKYYDEDGNPILNGDLIGCSGVARDIDVQGLGTVTAIYDFQAFVTPREERNLLP